MITHPAFTVEPWAVTEEGLHLDVLAQSESVFALSNGHIGMRGDQAAHHRQDRVGGGGDAEQNLVVRIIEIEGRAQRVVGVIVDAAERADDADGGLPLRFAKL